MNCIRCDKNLGHADKNNADYVIADDFIVSEKRQNLYAITDKGETKIKSAEESLLIPEVQRVEIRIEDTLIQKTGVVCPDCYKGTDFIIWGIHKET